MIGRRELIAGITGMAALGWPATVRAVAERVRLIGILMSIGDSPEGQSRISALRERLQALGWIDGRNVRMEIRWASGDAERMRVYSAELAALAPDLILVNGTQPATILLRQAPDVPIVFVQVSDPLASGLVRSLPHPGANITGFSSNEEAVLGKCVEVLKDIAPRTTRAAFLFNPDDRAWTGYWRAGESVAPSLHVELVQIAVREASDMQAKIEVFAREPDHGLLLQPTSVMNVNRELIVALAARLRLPAVYPQRAYAEAGGLASYGVDTGDQFRRVARYIDRILRGEKPGNLPVQPTRFELVLNLKTAKALGLGVPAELRHLADAVIE
jgi:putative ABC transport system substrate-binding protein